MARDTPIPIQLGQYVAARTVATLFQCFDIDQNLETANVVGSVFFRTNANRRARAENNIALSFPHWSRERVAEVAERSMQYMFQMFMVDSKTAPFHERYGRQASRRLASWCFSKARNTGSLILSHAP